jgi:hypothetical protein
VFADIAFQIAARLSDSDRADGVLCEIMIGKYQGAVELKVKYLTAALPKDRQTQNNQYVLQW